MIGDHWFSDYLLPERWIDKEKEKVASKIAERDGFAASIKPGSVPMESITGSALGECISGVTRDPKPYQCTNCGRYFATLNDFDRHRMKGTEWVQWMCMNETSMIEIGMVKSKDGVWSATET